MRKKKGRLGNPLLVAAAVEAAKSPEIQKNVTKLVDYQLETQQRAMRTGGTILKGIAVVGIGILLVKGYQNWHKSKLMQKAATDKNIAAAMDIYNAIPAGYKKGDGSIWNPFGFMKDVINKVATIWEKTDRDKIIECGKKITDLQYCYKVFNQIYGENLRPLLQKALTGEDLNSFENLAKSKGTSASNTAVAASHKMAVVTNSDGVHLRSSPKISTTLPVIHSIVGNVLATAEFGKIVGYTTGIETMSQDKKTIFVQIKAASRKKMKTNGNVADVVVYAWKGGLEFMTQQEYNAKYGKMTNSGWFYFP